MRVNKKITLLLIGLITNHGKTVAFGIALSLVIVGTFLLLQVVSYSKISAATSYKLPWKAQESYKVDQGWKEGTHKNIQMQFAYDFGLPEGIELRAAASGVVAHARGDVTTCGGYDQRNTVNYVTINHDDGSATLYLHLKEVWVSPGQPVQQGDPIGLSGKTGYTDTGSGCYPHLHFQRQEQGIWITNSKEIYFDEYPSRQFNDGDTVTSQNNSGGQATSLQVEVGIYDLTDKYPTNVQPSSFNPDHPQRDLEVQLLNSSNVLVYNHLHTVQYNSAERAFTGLVNLGNFQPGPYIVRLKLHNTLRRQVLGFVTIGQGATITLPRTALVPGDVNGDNRLNILDYNLLMGCYSDLFPARDCPADIKPFADINDDGNVNQFDYNIMLKAFGNQAGD